MQQSENTRNSKKYFASRPQHSFLGLAVPGTATTPLLLLERERLAGAATSSNNLTDVAIMIRGTRYACVLDVSMHHNRSHSLTRHLDSGGVTR